MTKGVKNACEKIDIGLQVDRIVTLINKETEAMMQRRKTTLAAALPIVLTLILAAGCAKKKPVEETPAEQTPAAPTETVTDTKVENRALDFNPQGSDSGTIDGLYTIHFEFDKANLTTEGKALAQKDADWMKAHPNATVQIEGHCDRHGSIEYNLALGERRAKTVRTYIAALGIDSSRMAIISYGKEKPLDSAETDAADAKNRRANFIVSGK
jgi:peptidoglycan-associated lipoprotein